jgi:hypothetical protein
MQYSYYLGFKTRRLSELRYKEAPYIATSANGTILARMASYENRAAWLRLENYHIEPEIIIKINITKSRIFISFDNLGSKYERISIISIIIYLINLLEFLNYKKININLYFSFCLVYFWINILYKIIYYYLPIPIIIWYYF